MVNKTIKILFVCDSGLDRSKTFKKHFLKIHQDKGNIKTFAKGIDAYNNKDQLTKEDIDIADEIYCMTYKQFEWIKNNIKDIDINDIKIIGVDNDYFFDDNKLISFIHSFENKWLINNKNLICDNCNNISIYNGYVEISFGYLSNFDGDTYRFCSDECCKKWFEKNL